MLSNARAGWRELGRDLQLILVSAGLMGLTFFGVFNALFNLYLLRLGYDAAFVGWVNSVASLAQAVVCIPASMLGRRLGGKRVMMLGMATVVAGMAAASVSELVPHGAQPAWIIASRVLTAGALAVYFPSMAPALMALARAGRQDAAFSTQWFMMTLGSFAGNLLGGWLPGVLAGALRSSTDQPAPYRYALAMAAVTLLLGFWALTAMRAALLPGREEPASGLAQSSRPPYSVILIFSLVNFFWMAGMNGVHAFLNVYLDAGLNTPLTTIGAVLAAAQLASAGASLITPKVVGRLGRRKAIVGAQVLAVGLLLPLVFIPSAAAAGFSYLSFSSLSAVVAPMSMVFGQLLIASRWRAVMSGARGTAAGLGSSAASLLGALTITSYGYSAFFLVSVSFVAVSALFFAWHYRTPRGEMGLDD